MATPLHPAVAHVTERIRERSAATRAAYLARIHADANRTDPRERLSCANLAHAFAADSADDRLHILVDHRTNIGIVTSYNDMLSAHRPYENYPELIRDALYPYPAHLVIATKAGLERSGPDQWRTDGRPGRLQAHCEASLRRLGLDRIPLFQLHRVDPAVPFADQLGALVELREQGKIEHIGLSEVGVEQIEAARAITPIVSVQNMYNLVNRGHDPVLAHCEREGIVFIPWVPLGSGSLVGVDGPLSAVASSLRVSPSQLALAWLLQRSPVMAPSPGTRSVAHLEQNVRAAAVRLILAGKANGFSPEAIRERLRDLYGGR